MQDLACAARGSVELKGGLLYYQVFGKLSDGSYQTSTDWYVQIDDDVDLVTLWCAPNQTGWRVSVITNPDETVP